MTAREAQDVCAIVLIMDGFDEVEIVLTLSILRQSGICTKSVSLTDGLICGAHGILLKSDYSLSNLLQSINLLSINLLVLPSGVHNIAELEMDPRVHHLFEQLIAHGGFIATTINGQETLKTIFTHFNHNATLQDSQILLRQPQTQSVDAFIHILAHRFVGLG